MFEHVTVLLSFVYALALTHLLSTAGELAVERGRIRISGLHAVWMLNALLLLVLNWLGLWGLAGLKQWGVLEVAMQFAAALVQYFTCSTFALPTQRGAVVDVPTLYDERRPVTFGAFLALGLIEAFLNYWDRNATLGRSPTVWIAEDLSIAPMLVAVLVAGWARPRWLQWLAALAMVAMSATFLIAFALPSA